MWVRVRWKGLAAAVVCACACGRAVEEKEAVAKVVAVRV